MGTANRGTTGAGGAYRGYRAQLRGGIGGAASLGGAVLSAMLMLLSPAASATITNGTNTAPYTNTHLWTAKYDNLGGCATAKAKRGVWSAATGVGGVKALGASKQCSFSALSNYAYSSSVAIVVLGATVTSTGSYTVDVNVTYTDAVTASVSNGSCTAATVSGASYTYSACAAFGEWAFFFSVWMVDATNGTTYYGTVAISFNYNSQFSYSYCYSGSCSWSNTSALFSGGSTGGSGANDVFIYPNYPLDSTHKYWIYLEADAYVLTTVYGNGNQAGAGTWIGGASATESANLASLGNSWAVNFVKIS